MTKKFAMIFLAALAVCAFAAFGAPAEAGSVLLLGTVAPVSISAAQWKELSEAVHDAMKSLSDRVTGLNDRMRDVEQRADRRPGNPANGGRGAASMASIIVDSEGIKAFKNGVTRDVSIKIPREIFAVAITESGSATTGTVYPLVPGDRPRGIAAAPNRRLTIRDLFTGVSTNSNMVEVVKENVFTNNAGPQYDTSSPTPGQEGAIKGESGITFTLSQVPVTTVAHWLPASKQILDDAPGFDRYIEARLLYGLKLEEEEELLNGTGSNGELNGLVTQATAFTGGVTNQTALDTLAKAICQLASSEYQATGIVLNPTDWLAIRLLKDTQGRYLLPMDMPRADLWGVPVVATNSMTAGNFLVLDAPRAGYIADREDANVQVSNSHADFFTRNLVAIRCEERLALAVERTGALIKGSLSYAG